MHVRIFSNFLCLNDNSVRITCRTTFGFECVQFFNMTLMVTAGSSVKPDFLVFLFLYKLECAKCSAESNHECSSNSELSSVIWLYNLKLRSVLSTYFCVWRATFMILDLLAYLCEKILNNLL